MSPWFPLLCGMLPNAQAGFGVDPADPPTRLQVHADGGVRVQFPQMPHPVDSAAAAVVTLRRHAAVPDALRRVGTSLGRSERNWWVPVSPGGPDALDLAVDWAAHPAVRAAIPDLLLETVPAEAPIDDPERGAQWYLDLLGMDALHAETLGDPAVRLGIADSAVDVEHPDLIHAVVSPYDAVDDDTDPSPVPGAYCTDGPECLDGHGTAVAGLTNAAAHNGVGIVGMCPDCSLVPVRLVGGGGLSAEVAAYEHLVDADAWVINNSWGRAVSQPVPDALEEVIHRAATENRGGLGAVIIFIAGNQSRLLTADELQGLPDVLCVSGTDRYDNPVNYSNFGDVVGIAAPSATVTLAPAEGIDTAFGGTSAAGPLVSGLAGWILSVDPELTAPEVRQMLMDTARKPPQVAFDDAGHHEDYGYGILDPGAVQLALHPVQVPPVQADPPDGVGGCGCAAGGRFGLGWGIVVTIALARRRTRR